MRGFRLEIVCLLVVACAGECITPGEVGSSFRCGKARAWEFTPAPEDGCYLVRAEPGDEVVLGDGCPDGESCVVAGPGERIRLWNSIGEPPGPMPEAESAFLVDGVCPLECP